MEVAGGHGTVRDGVVDMVKYLYEDVESSAVNGSWVSSEKAKL